MKKLLFVLTNINNFISHRIGLAQALKAQNYDIHIALPAASEAKMVQLQAHGFHVHLCDIDRKNLKPHLLLSNYHALKNLISTIDPDIIFPVSLKALCFVGLVGYFHYPGKPLMCLVTGLGLLYTKNHLSYRLLRFLIEHTITLSAKNPHFHLIFQNPDDRQYFLDKKLIPENQTALVNGSGVAVEKYSTHHITVPQVQIVFAGRLLREKGIFEFLDAAVLLHKKGIHANFIVAGEIDKKSISAITEKDFAPYAKHPYIQFIGWQCDLASTFERSDIVCFPSYYREGIPKVLLEALAAGRPIVTTNMPGCRETVSSGENGLLVPPKNTSQLADALAQLIADKPLREKMGKHSRTLAETQFSETQVIAKTLAILQNA